jgi:hypothetical protein
MEMRMHSDQSCFGSAIFIPLLKELMKCKQLVTINISRLTVLTLEV